MISYKTTDIFRLANFISDFKQVLCVGTLIKSFFNLRIWEQLSIQGWAVSDFFLYLWWSIDKKDMFQDVDV